MGTVRQTREPLTLARATTLRTDRIEIRILTSLRDGRTSKVNSHRISALSLVHMAAQEKLCVRMAALMHGERQLKILRSCVPRRHHTSQIPHLVVFWAAKTVRMLASTRSKRLGSQLRVATSMTSW